MPTICSQPLAPRGVDGLAIIGRTLHDLRGVRFDDGEDGNKPDGDKPEEKPDGDKPDDKPDEKKFSQADVDRIVADRLARQQRQQDKPKPEAPKPKDEQPKALTEEDVQRRIDDALATRDADFALERAGIALDKALDGRVFSASAIRALDMKQFVKDGKTDDAAIKTWVEKNSTEGERKVRRDPGQGQRGSTSTGGAVSAGRDLFDNEKKPKKKKE